MVKDFNPKSNEFTLEKIIEFGFDNYAELIHDISGAASKEVVIEQVEIMSAFRGIPHCCTLICTWKF